MIKIPEKTGQVSVSKPADLQTAASSRVAKRKYTDRQMEVPDQQEVKNSQHRKKQSAASRIEDALAKPSKSNSSFSRFMDGLKRQDVELSTGRTFQQMMEKQSTSSRPLIIAKCLCDGHSQDEKKDIQFMHPEFMDGHVVFEALTHERLAPEIKISEFGDFSPTNAQRKTITNFITKDIEFWAINPSTRTHDVIATRSMVMSKTPPLSAAIEALLLVGVGFANDEDEDDHAFAYVGAGLYYSGIVVRKDESLAQKSVELIRSQNLPFAQATAFYLAFDMHLDVFTSLLDLGLDPRDVEESGRSIIDTIKSSPETKRGQSALAILQQRGYL